jgi:hypothetical protein
MKVKQQQQQRWPKNTIIKNIYGDILLYIFIPCMLANTIFQTERKKNI